MGDGGDHRQFLARAAYRKGHRRFAHRGVAAAAHIGIDDRRFIAPVNLRAFGFGTLLNLGVLLIQPILNGLGTLLVSLLDRLLRGES